MKALVRTGLVLVILSAVCQLDSLAQEVQKITLERFVREAFEKNAALQAKKKGYEAARHRVIASWLPEDPMIGVDVEGQQDLFRFDERMNNEYMIEQTIPFPTKLILRRVVASKEADRAYQEYKEEERNLVWHIEQPYYELFLAKKTLAVLEENQALLKQILGSARVRYEANEAPQADVLKAQIELSKNGVEIFNVREREHLAEAHFSHLVGQSLETRYVIENEERVPGFSYTRGELEEIALRKRPELKAMEIGIEKAGAARDLTKSGWLPDITARIEARQFKGEGSIRERDTFIGFSVPVWSILKGIGGEWASSDKELEEAKALYEDTKNEVLLELHKAHSKARAARNAVETYENLILPQAKQQIAVALASYQAGRQSLLEVLDAQRMLKMIQIEYYKSLAEHEMAISDLRLTVGDNLRGYPNEKQ